MNPDKDTPTKSVVQRAVAIACAVVFGLAVTACGSSANTGTNNNTPTTKPTSPATTAPPTTAPKSGGAGF